MRSNLVTLLLVFVGVVSAAVEKLTMDNLPQHLLQKYEYLCVYFYSHESEATLKIFELMEDVFARTQAEHLPSVGFASVNIEEYPDLAL